MEPSDKKTKEPKSKFGRMLAADPELKARYTETVARLRAGAEQEIQDSERSTQFTADDFNQRIGSSGPVKPGLRERVMKLIKGAKESPEGQAELEAIQDATQLTAVDLGLQVGCAV